MRNPGYQTYVVLREHSDGVHITARGSIIDEKHSRRPRCAQLVTAAIDKLAELRSELLPIAPNTPLSEAMTRASRPCIN